MVNKRRGEVALQAGGETFTLCLTLGALAELEDIYGGEDILAIASRFSSGNLTSRDAVNLLKASMKGGGHNVNAIDFDQLSFEGGMAGLIGTLAMLLQVTFSTEFSVSGEEKRESDTGEDGDSTPFPGSRF